MSRVKTLSEALIQAEAKGQDRPALYYFDTVMTYGELLDTVMRVAQGLKTLGVKPRDRVAVMLQNMPASVVVHFAVWALGAAVVPVNVMLTRGEIGAQLMDAGASVLVALTSLADRVEGLDQELSALDAIVLVDDRQDFSGMAPLWLPPHGAASPPMVSYQNLLDQPPLNPEQWVPTNEGDMALLTYTSGTTGVPKGAVNTHGQMLHNVFIYESLALLSGDTVNVAFAPLFHITGSVAGLAAAVGLAAPLVLLYRFDPRVAAEAIQRRRAEFTVGAITTYLGMLALEDLDAYDLSSLTRAYSGGAPVAEATLTAFHARTGIYIHNVYGLTESNNGLIMVPWGERAPVDPESGALSIGRTGSGVEASIRDMDDPRQEVPAGSLGELALKGPSIIEAYWQRPDANRASFIDGWFLTGDVARMSADGWIYIVDRKKDVIISAGNKVWPRDVEDALYQHPGVLEAVVVGLPDPYRGEAVTAFVVRSSAGANLEPKELEAFLRERLAAYKIPRAIHWVDSIPKTATGKFLRRAFRQ
ncbi:class I adenylate-forming enzyme family protein [Sulfobacillus harzensis]|uniref:Long-chain fatty acid--CoA ligase n=1 Tax=Sulfobacillus harzensis TaxID=2729629 RepID=A0A7Y0Q4Z2_9FIRM|nr:AMP-binding protein [Sulfobacillus harzensis]NMP23719.1 long-chain fatty acid--CoA ligase [Sulfobacillus harzensis]